MKKRTSININPIVLTSITLLLALMTFEYFSSKNIAYSLIKISTIAIILGALFESGRISDKLSTVFYITIWSLILGLIAFLPHKNEGTYLLKNHIEDFPFLFLIIFIVLTMFSYEHKVVRRLTEGVTLMQSIAFIYFLIDIGILKNIGILKLILLSISVLFIMLSVLNAFSTNVLTNASRFTLSIWSSIMMILFAIDYIYRVYNYKDIESLNSTWDRIFITTQFFFLGVASVYMAHNFFMLIGFIPGRHNKMQHIGEMLTRHDKRYSKQQVNIFHSLLYVTFSGMIFYINYRHKFLPRHFVIWLVFITFPLLVGMTNFNED